MSTDIVQSVTNLDTDIRYAQAVTTTPERGAISLLPKAYQGNPANVLIAIGLGQAIGISPAQALYEIYVVNNRPSPSANLMAALCRRAGHKLRIKGDTQSCTATLIRADDPDEPFQATWTFEQAQRAGLTNKDTWKAYPAAMLRARAISEVVRMGASEAVIGMDYSAEEMRDVEDDRAPVKAQPAGSDALRAAVGVEPKADEITVEVIEPDPITPAQSKALHASLNDAGITARQARLDYCRQLIGRDITSSSDLTKDEASRVINALQADVADFEAPAADEAGGA